MAQALTMEKEGASYEEVDLLVRGKTYQGVIEGDIEDGRLFAGQITGLIKEIKPVKDIIEEMVAGAESVMAGLKYFQREK